MNKDILHTHTRTRIYIYTHMYTLHTQTYIPTYLPTYLRTYVPTYLHTYAPTHLRTYARTHIRTYARTHVRTYIPTYLHTYIPTYLHTYIPTYPHTHIPTYLHTYIHTHIQLYMHGVYRLIRLDRTPRYGLWLPRNGWYLASKSPGPRPSEEQVRAQPALASWFIGGMGRPWSNLGMVMVTVPHPRNACVWLRSSSQIESFESCDSWRWRPVSNMLVGTVWTMLVLWHLVSSAVVAQTKLREEFSRLACASAPPQTSWRVRLRWVSKWFIFCFQWHVEVVNRDVILYMYYIYICA